ncbi:MAG TPA: histidine kinase, partial [Casimicrobiaceae bacterium]|nr:histidine kinase [Casimicrobiaceae bacterium]
GMLQRPSLIAALAATFIADQLGAFVLLLAVVVADRVAGARSSRRTAYAVAVVASATVSAPVGSIVALSIVENGPTLASFVNSTVYTFCDWVILSGAAVFVYTDRRRARAARDRMHAAELERSHAARRALESRLQAMQARVEPRFLFNTLAQVRDLYRANAVLGARMLDELIAYLRAAMPTMRDTTSTVGREVELVRAWLGIAGLRLGEPITVDFELPDALAQARMPAMMLLPLVDRATAHGGRSLRLRATAGGARMRISIAGAGIARLRDSEELVAVRDRLAALYGVEANAELSASEETAEVVLTMPLGGVEATPTPASGAAATGAAAGRAAS